MRRLHLAALCGLCGGVTQFLVGCSDDDCSITLTCPPVASGGGGSAAASTGGSETGGAGGEVPGAALGAACGTGSECASGECVDGVCCDTGCEDECSSCALEGSLGTCTLHAAGSDPDGECELGVCSGAALCANGAEVWSELFTISSGFSSHQLATDASGNIFLAALGFGDASYGATTIPSEGGVTELIVTKLSPDGALLWHERASLADNDYSASFDMAVDADGGLMVVGFAQKATDLGGPTFGDSSGGDIFLTRLQADGSHDRTHVIPKGAGFNPAEIHSVAIDGDGSTYVFGTVLNAQFSLCSKNLGDTTAAMAFGFKVGPSGSCVWGHEWAADNAQIRKVGTSGSTLLLTGSFSGTLNFGNNALTTTGDSNLLLAAFDTVSGTTLWSADYGDGANQYGSDLTVLPNDEFAIVGTADGAIDLGGGVLPPGGASDVIVGRFGLSGSHSASFRYGDADAQAGTSIAADDFGNYVVGAFLDGTTDFGNVSAIAPSGRTYTLSFHATNVALWAHPHAEALGAGVDLGDNGTTVVLTRVDTNTIKLTKLAP